MPALETFSVDYLVRGFDCGYGGPFTPFALANYFQEAAGLHADALGIGMADLAAAGRTWMLSRICVRIDGLPREGDRVRVRTWPSGCERLFALRDLVLESETGEALVRAVYAYLVVDFEARKPLRPERALEAARLGSAPHALADFSLGTAPLEGAELVYELRARPRHIDENGHVNNAHYVNWLVDAAQGRAGREAAAGRGVDGGTGAPRRALRALKLDFVREVLEGELLQVFAGSAAFPSVGAAAGPGAGESVGAELRRGDETVARAELSFAG